MKKTIYVSVGNAVKYIKNVLHKGNPIDIGVENGKIVSILPPDASREGKDFCGGRIYPGLIDIHSHGCMGLDTCVGGVEQMSDWQLAHGTTTWYPTTMTVSAEEIISATHAELNAGHGANVPGFHLEGPFINVKYKGAQNEKHILPPSLELLRKCENVKLITVAPETDGAIEFIRECPCVVAIGHTDCTYETAMAAFAAGAKSLTHTYNCMNGIHHRNPGPIPAGMDSGAYAQLICDGKHVHPSAVRTLYRMYGANRIVLISDSIQATDVGDGEYIFGGQPITVCGGTARTAEGNLAGSTSSLFECLKTAISFGIPEEDALKMATSNPADLMGLNKGRIEIGYDADFIIVDAEWNLVKSIVRGEF